MRTYAIGDIHGHIELLREVHSWIAADQAKHGAAPIVHIGDLVDRGPDCAGVVESYLHPKIGGAATLESYGVKNAADRPLAPVHAEAVAAVPEAHLQFLESRSTYYQRGGVIYVHAGIRPGIPIEQQTEDDLVWIRKGFLEDTRDFGALIVHGHTALDAPMHYGNRVNIDSSAAYGGPLTAVVLEGREVFKLTIAGRVALLPE